MELKSYQSGVIEDLEKYLVNLEAVPDLRQSFADFWAEKGLLTVDPYKNNVPGVPHICAKVPTAGGKTYIAVNALKSIFDAFATHNPERPKLAVWLVPSLTILDQTIKNLSDPEHPYRQRLNLLFRGRVSIYERKDLLMGAGFSADTVREQLSIVVMSFDSLRARNKDDRKIFQDNGYLASFVQTTGAADWLLPNYDETALINVLRGLKPVVVVDESHNAESSLSIEMLANLNPHFILDLTATPRNNSNIISYVDAMALKQNHMVKLPVIVSNRSTRSEVVESAVILRRQLEKLAIEQEAKGGKYIRPIVLFQAQPRTSEDNTTFEKVREQLVKAGIPLDEIKIKTAEINELKGIDLLSRNCPVRFIITINALKEGWDCPFAYILASLADKSSAVDVEQILGRVLRMPHVQQHGVDLLNLSYVFTASSKFQETLQSVVRALNRAGFSDKDYRTIDPLQAIPEPQPAPMSGDLFGLATQESMVPVVPGADEMDWPEAPIVVPDTPADAVSEAAVFVEAVKVQAVIENQKFEAKAAESSILPAELEAKMNKHKLKDIFRDEALALRLPQFFEPIANAGWFAENNEQQLLERESLLKDFRLVTADAAITFEDVAAEMYKIDLEKSGDGNYAPKPFKIDVNARQRFNALILSQSRDSQVRDVVARITALIGNMLPITDSEVKAYVKRIIDMFTPEQLRDCLDHDLAYVRKIKKKIDQLSNVHAFKVFSDMLDVDKLTLEPNFGLPEVIAPSANAPALLKSLYSTEASMGSFEAMVIDSIANLDSVKWWHRNLSRGKGFRINGFINHYPDFIIKMKSGRVIVLETKGDDRDNSDSESKLKLGKLWESKAGSSYKYMMVFDSNPVSGAEKLANALNKLGQM